MTRLYLDTEFNGFGGELLSLALVADAGDWQWYECLDPPGLIWNAWVHEFVLPRFGQAPIPGGEFRRRFVEFIASFDRPEIIADWHTDVMHFCKLLDGGRFEESVPFEGSFTVIQTPPGQPQPENPHNALSDAIALRDWHLAQLESKREF